MNEMGHSVVQLVEEPRYKQEGRCFDSPIGTLRFLIDLVFPAELCPWDRLSF
jgi:hypothetical protein